MLYVKNVSSKPIGFGKLVLLPDETKPLPDGYDEKHPTVAFYLGTTPAFLVKVDAKAESDKRAAEASAEAAAKKAEAEAAAKIAEEEKAAADAAAKAEILDAKIKELAKMNLDPLRELARGMEIAFDDADTKAILIQKITTKYQEE